MSTVNDTAIRVTKGMPTIAALRKWMARRRIAISITCFTTLVVFNLVILGTPPTSPLKVWIWNSGLGMALIIGGLAIRSWSAGTLHKHQELTTIGPYALVRNPLYVGSFLMMYGFAFIMSDWLSILFIAGPMSLLYYLQVLHEEKHLASNFAQEWPKYTKQTSRFVPTRINPRWRSGWSAAQWLRNREYQAILGAGLGVVGLIVLALQNS